MASPADISGGPRMSRSLALTGIALIAASVVAGCRGGTPVTLANGPDPGVPHGRISRGEAPRPGQAHIRHPRDLAPRGRVVRRPARRGGHALAPGCRRVAGGFQCVSTRGVDRDWVINDGDDQNPTRSLIDPKD